MDVNPIGNANNRYYGTLIANTRRVTADFTLTNLDYVVFCDTDDNAITVTLPAGAEGTNYKIINCGNSGNDLSVDPQSDEELYGAGVGVASTLSDGEVINIHFNETEGWW